MFQGILGNGHLGVELFFVISGFVLSLPFARYYLKEGKESLPEAIFYKKAYKARAALFFDNDLSFPFEFRNTFAYCQGSWHRIC